MQAHSRGDTPHQRRRWPKGLSIERILPTWCYGPKSCWGSGRHLGSDADCDSDKNGVDPPEEERRISHLAARMGQWMSALGWKLLP